MSTRNYQTWALIPFYASREAYDKNKKALQKTVTLALKHTDRVVVINDGTDIEESDLVGDVIFYSLGANLGKAEAVRRGIHEILCRTNNAKDLIVQIDADLDQNPQDAVLFTEMYSADTRLHDELTLLIGDRYHNLPQNLSQYRKDLLKFFQTLMLELGYSVRDIQSGFRAYNVALARCFVKIGTSHRYGIEAEQAIVAASKKALIVPVFLTESRLRDHSTDAQKWIDNMTAIMAHRAAFKGQGVHGQLDTVYRVYGEVASKMSQHVKDFTVNLPDARVMSQYHFYMIGNSRYTVERED